MVRSFRLILLNNYVIFFLWLALFGECADDLVDCGHPFHICGKDEDYYTDSCSENDIQNWYFGKVEMQDKKPIGNCSGLKEEKAKPPFKNLELFAFPIKNPIRHEGFYWAKLCINASHDDLNSTDWLDLEICADGFVHTINITKRNKICQEKNEQPVTLLCYWNWLLTKTGPSIQVKIKLSSQQFSETFRATLPNWEKYNGLTPTGCTFEPFIYSSQTGVHVSSKNCTSRFNVTILSGKEEIAEFTNVTLTPNLEYKFEEEDEQRKESYYEVIVKEISDNATDQENFTTTTTNFNDVTTELINIDMKHKLESHPPYFLLYLIPIILIVVMSIACFILRKDMDVIWGKISGRSKTKTPSVKFLYCNCSSHAIYSQQLKSFLLFIERYCNINIVDNTEHIYADNESLLHKATIDTDYAILVPMPELSTPDSEDESYFQNLQQEFNIVKESKQIILKLPFQGEIRVEGFVQPKSEYYLTSKLCKVELIKRRNLHQPAIFTLMDEFIPFLQHVHRKYQRRIFHRRRDFLSRDKMNEIQQKLEDYNLTNVGFEFLRNNLTTGQLVDNDSISFINLDNMSL